MNAQTRYSLRRASANARLKIIEAKNSSPAGKKTGASVSNKVARVEKKRKIDKHQLNRKMSGVVAGDAETVNTDDGRTVNTDTTAVEKTAYVKDQVFRTPKKGWGVRSWDHIPCGAPVCEYIGLLRRTDDLNPAADNSYVFDIDCLQTMKGLEGRESRLRAVSLPSYLQKLGEEVSESVPFCIDAGYTGNVARFINHSCQPNLFVQCMLSNHHDIKLARMMLIAAENIPPLKELTYDYGYALNIVMGPDGKVQQMPCFCGADECRRRLYLV